MFANARIAEAFDTMVGAIDVPPAPVAGIKRRALEPSRPARRRLPYLAAAAAMAILVLAMPLVAPSFTQSIEAQIEAILHWKPPPPAPASVESAMRSQTGTLAEAQARVDFTIVPPKGLPRDTASEQIATTPTGVYSKITHSWSVGSPNVWFIYRRKNGGAFTLLADRVDPRQGPPPNYMFEELGTRNGHPILAKHRNFAWRNGDQVMSADAGDGLSAAEILAIRSAMHGSPYHGSGQPRTIEKQYRLP